MSSDPCVRTVQTSQSRPLVTVVVPVRNEAAFIERLVDSVLNQTYPRDRIEVIVSDGRSTDGTRAVLENLERTYSQLMVIDNPKRIVSTGLNLAINKARGDIIVRVDGHATVAPDFLSEIVTLFEQHPEAWSVGGPIRHAATTTFGKAVSIAMSHPVGVGNALHRYVDYEGYVEGAQFPAIRRSVFGRVGMFDERLVRNQDDEFNYRMRVAGGQIYVSPSVRYSYYVREHVGQLFRQYFQYGFWRIPVIEKHRRPTTLRQVAPTLFYVASLMVGLLGWYWGRPEVALLLPLGYLGILLSVGAANVRRTGLRVAALVPAAIAIIHAGYAWGFGYGLWARLFRSDAWDVQGKMATLSR
jgi:glycosyltransferase involved in cell wall biosynthesis